MTQDLSAQLVERLDALIALSLCHLLTVREPKDIIVPLARAGVAPKSIAHLLGVNPVTVRTALHRSRQRGRKPSRRARKRQG